MAAGLTIACVYKPGGGFTDEYVYRLREGVAKHCHVPHRFVVLTNEKFEDFETIRFTRNGETRSRTVPISEADHWRAQGVSAGWTVVQ